MVANDEYKIIKFRDDKQIKIPLSLWGTRYHTELFLLSKITFENFPWGHVQTTIYGGKRVGKSVYTIKSMMEQNRILFNMTPDAAFKHAMKRTYFTVREFIDDMKELRATDEYIPSCHLDDAGSGFSKYLWNKKGGRSLAQELQGVIETIGTRVIALNMTSASVDSMLSFLQSYEGKIIHIIKNTEEKDPWRRKAKMYRWNALPSGTMRIDTHIEEETFSCLLEQKYFDVYWGIRDAYLSANLDKLDEAEKMLGAPHINQKIANDVLKILSERLQRLSS